MVYFAASSNSNLSLCSFLTAHKRARMFLKVFFLIKRLRHIIIEIQFLFLIAAIPVVSEDMV